MAVPRLALARVCLALGACLGPALFSSAAQGQAFPREDPIELSASVDVQEATGATRNRLLQVDAFREGERWEDAIDTLLQVLESDGDSLVRLTGRRLISVRRYCHLQFAKLQGEPLKYYRRRVDAEAEKWLEQGRLERATAPLERVVELAFCSRWGDEALDLLGEMALEQGDYATARDYWSMLLPPGADDAAGKRLNYPRSPSDDSAAVDDIPVADVRARLALTSILEGALPRAREELAAFKTEFPQAAGRLAGTNGSYAARLEQLLRDSSNWPAREPRHDWPTFAGGNERNGIAAKAIDPAAVAWRVSLSPAPKGDANTVRQALRLDHGVAEPFDKPLSYFPVVVDNQLIVQTSEWQPEATPDNQKHKIIHAFDLTHRVNDPAVEPAPAWEIEKKTLLGALPDVGAKQLTGRLGMARYTMTVHGRRLYLRLGSSVTGWSGHDVERDPSYLAGVDLATRKVVFGPIESEPGWSFDGAPVCDGRWLYCVMRRSDVRPQLHIAAFDTATRQLAWRKLVCAAESPARSNSAEVTHSLLTLHRNTLYLNTNLGAVAAVSTRDGHVRWLTTYPRAKLFDLSRTARHFLRDITPCVYYEGLLLAAPSDSPSILGLDAESGEFLWATQPVEDVVHLLGAAKGYAIASGQRLYWIDLARQGRIAATFPDPGAKEPRGHGRGVLAGDVVYWPTEDRSIHVLTQQPDRENAIPIVVRPPIALETRTGADERPVHTGNLLVAGDLLIIASNDELVALGQQAPLTTARATTAAKIDPTPPTTASDDARSTSPPQD